MKIAVINFSGNVGKTTVATHLLLPRIPGARFVAVEGLNAHDSDAQALRGRQFGQLQEFLQTVDSAVVDIGASNVEELLALMHRYRRSHEDFDCFLVPTVPPAKQQQDTIATLAELTRLGVPASRIRLVFNMVEDGVDVSQAFGPVLAFARQGLQGTVNHECRIGTNEVYERVKGIGIDLGTFAEDVTDYKALIAKTPTMVEKLALAQKLAIHRLAAGVVPELDACFTALNLGLHEQGAT